MTPKLDADRIESGSRNGVEQRDDDDRSSAGSNTSPLRIRKFVIDSLSGEGRLGRAMAAGAALGLSEAAS